MSCPPACLLGRFVAVDLDELTNLIEGDGASRQAEDDRGIRLQDGIEISTIMQGSRRHPSR